MFLFMVVSLAFVFWTLQSTNNEDRRQYAEFRSQIVQNCVATEIGNTKVNALLERVALAAASNSERTPEQRQQSAADYRELKLPLPVCPPDLVTEER